MAGVVNDAAPLREDAPKVTARSLELLETHCPVASAKRFEKCLLLSVNIEDWDWNFSTSSAENERDGGDICYV